MKIEFELPWPVSVNQYYRHVGPRVLISRDGVKYREIVTHLLSDKPKLHGKIKFAMDAYPPDRRRRDLDNLMKCVWDSLTHAGIYDDDSQIKLLYARMLEPIENGKVCIRMEDEA